MLHGSDVYRSVDAAITIKHSDVRGFRDMSHGLRTQILLKVTVLSLLILGVCAARR